MKKLFALLSVITLASCSTESPQLKPSLIHSFKFESDSNTYGSDKTVFTYDENTHILNVIGTDEDGDYEIENRIFEPNPETNTLSKTWTEKSSEGDFEVTNIVSIKDATIEENFSNKGIIVYSGKYIYK